MKPIAYLISTVSLFFFTGCIPKQHIIRPSVEGKVIDSRSKLPLSNVMITEEIYTDENGYFLLPQERETGIGTLMGGIWNISRIFTVRKEGYLPLGCICEVLNSNGTCRSVTIAMRKNSEGQNLVTSESGTLSCTPLLRH
jgi:hypothetical protein